MRQTSPVLNLLSDGYRSLNPFNGPAGFTSLSLSPPNIHILHISQQQQLPLVVPSVPSIPFAISQCPKERPKRVDVVKHFYSSADGASGYGCVVAV